MSDGIGVAGPLRSGTTGTPSATRSTGAPGARGRSRRSAWLAANRTRLTGIASVILGIVLWQVVAKLFFSPLFLPPPSAVWSRGVELAQDGTLWDDIKASGQSYLLGLLIAIAAGGIIGTAMAA